MAGVTEPNVLGCAFVQTIFSENDMRLCDFEIANMGICGVFTKSVTQTKKMIFWVNVTLFHEINQISSTFQRWWSTPPRRTPPGGMWCRSSGSGWPRSAQALFHEADSWTGSVLRLLVRVLEALQHVEHIHVYRFLDEYRLSLECSASKKSRPGCI